MVKVIPLMVPGAKTNGGELKVYAPYNDAFITSIAAANSGTIDRALENAHGVFHDRDAWLKPYQRAAILEKTAQLMTERAGELAVEAAREGGKPLVDSKVEVARAIDGVKECVEYLRSDSGKEIPMGLTAAAINRVAFTRREPIGVIVAVSAFNHPLNLIVHQVAPAVAVGAPVVVKPAEDTPLSCFRFVEMLYEAGLPPEWCQPVVVTEIDNATKLVTDPRVSFLTFIGSARVGWMLRSKLAPGTRCALEHGGAAPVIVAEDADLDATIPALAKAGFYHAGQVCVSVQRVFAHRSIVDEVATRLAQAAGDATVGDPTLPDTDVGPLIRHAEVERVEEWVNEAIEGGAGCLAGGKRISNSCYECTILVDPLPETRVSQLEIFGPVICVYSYDDIDQAITRANSLPFAFQAAVFTRSIDTAMRVYNRIDASAVMVNEHTAFRVDWMPFAGLKQSGLGTGGIPYTMRDMQVEKMMVLKSPEL